MGESAIQSISGTRVHVHGLEAMQFEGIIDKRKQKQGRLDYESKKVARSSRAGAPLPNANSQFAFAFQLGRSQSSL